MTKNQTDNHDSTPATEPLAISSSDGLGQSLASHVAAAKAAGLWPSMSHMPERFARFIAEIEAAERERMRALIADDASAMTYQTMGQYRTALLKALAEYHATQKPTAAQAQGTDIWAGMY